MYLHAELRARLTTNINSNIGDEMEALRTRVLDGINLNAGSGNDAPIDPALQLLVNIIDDFSPFFDFRYKGADLPAPWEFSLAWCTPKIAMLVDLLLKYHADSMKGIIFVDQRHVALLLAAILSRVPELHGRIQAGAIVGQGENDSAGASMGASVQHAILRDFREGKINIRMSRIIFSFEVN
jgi:endoribonuclease Dicer